MKKNILLTTLLISMLLVSCGKKDVEIKTEDNTIKPITTTEEKVIDTNTQEELTEEKVTSTMKELFKKGKPSTCTYKIKGEQGEVYDSIMYMDGKMLRYTMKGEIQGQKLENNVILKDGYSYSWSNMAPGGFKMKEDLNDNEENTSDTTKTDAEEMNKTIEFDCKKGVDSSMFELPSNINFQEYNMKGIPEMPAS